MNLIWNSRKTSCSWQMMNFCKFDSTHSQMPPSSFVRKKFDSRCVNHWTQSSRSRSNCRPYSTQCQRHRRGKSRPLCPRLVLLQPLPIHSLNCYCSHFYQMRSLKKQIETDLNFPMAWIWWRADWTCLDWNCSLVAKNRVKNESDKNVLASPRQCHHIRSEQRKVLKIKSTTCSCSDPGRNGHFTCDSLASSGKYTQ